MKTSALRVHSAMLTVAALFSINYIISKLAMHAFSPLSFAWLRVTGAAVVLNLLVPWLDTSPSPPAGKENARFLWVVGGLAILGVVLNQTMFLAGLSLTSAHVAAILITTIPVFTLLVAIVLGTERATPAKVAGIGLALTGALLIVGAEGTAGLTEAMAGTLLIIGNCFCYGVYLVVSKPVVSRFSPLRVMARMFAIGALLIFPLASSALRREHWAAVPRPAWLALGAVIVGPTVGAYLLSAWTLRYAESSLVAAYSYVQPVLTTLLAWGILGETIRPNVALAGLLIFAGVGLASRPGRREVDPGRI